MVDLNLVSFLYYILFFSKNITKFDNRTESNEAKLSLQKPAEILIFIAWYET